MGMKKKSNQIADYEGKREKLLEEISTLDFIFKRLSKSKKFHLIALLAVALPVSWWILRESPPTGSEGTPRSPVMENVSYQGRSVAMTKVEAIVGKGVVEVPVDLVKEKKLIYFEYRQGDTRIPMLAYITPSGRLVAAVSICEPCNSTSFHIEGNEMVCNACFTRWNLETLKGISGGCLNYPPDVLPHFIREGKAMIKGNDVMNWKPRVIRG